MAAPASLNSSDSDLPSLPSFLAEEETTKKPFTGPLPPIPEAIAVVQGVQEELNGMTAPVGETDQSVACRTGISPPPIPKIEGLSSLQKAGEEEVSRSRTTVNKV